MYVFAYFTVDIVAKHVSTQLLEGEPSAGLLNRFFRKGRRDGRRALPHGSVAKLLGDAVGLAGSSLCEELTRQEAEALQRMAQLRAAQSAYQQLLADQAHFDDALAGDAAEEGVGPSSSTGDDWASPESSRALTQALQSRERLRGLRRAGHLAAARAEGLRSAQDAASRADLELPGLQARVEELPEQYLQRFESIRHAGELLWARYCNGFAQGNSRRGSRESGVARPAGPLDFELPSALRRGARSKIKTHDKHLEPTP